MSDEVSVFSRILGGLATAWLLLIERRNQCTDSRHHIYSVLSLMWEICEGHIHKPGAVSVSSVVL